jgi:hypothetical protein
MKEWMYRSAFSWPRHNWRWVVSFTARPFYPRGKSPRFPLDRRLGWPKSRSGRRGVQKILCSPLKFDRPTKQKVTCFMLFLAWLVLRPSRWRRHVSPKHRLTINGLYGVISQKMEVFRYEISRAWQHRSIRHVIWIIACLIAWCRTSLLV